MRVVIGILGALAIVGYVVGMVLAVYSKKKPDNSRLGAAAPIMIIAAWVLTLAFAVIGIEKSDDWTISITAAIAVGFPVVGIILHTIKRLWIPRLVLVLGLLATPVLYIVLLVK